MVSGELAAERRAVDVVESTTLAGRARPPDDGVARAGTYVRVTIASSQRRVDLALPRVVPVADLMPQVLELCVPDFYVPDSARASPHRWRLTRLGSTPFDPDIELGATGVSDGEVLMLSAEPDDPPPAHIEDIRDATEDLIDEDGTEWHRRASLRCLIGLLIVVALSAAIAATVGLLGRPLAWVAALVFVPGLGFAAAWTHRLGEAAFVVPLVSLASVWAGVLGWFAPWWPALAVVADHQPRWLAGIQLVATASASAVTAGALRRAMPEAIHVAAAAGAVVLAALPLAAATAMHVAAPVGVGACAVGAVLVVGGLPRFAISAGGLAELDNQVRTDQPVGRTVLFSRLRSAGAVLTGSLVGVAGVAAVASSYLAAQPDPWARSLGVAVVVTLATRSRLFSQLAHVLVLRLAAACGCLAAATRLVADAPSAWVGGLVLGAVVATLLGLAVQSVRPLSEVGAARLARATTAVEWCAVAALLPLLAAASGLFDWVAESIR